MLTADCIRETVEERLSDRFGDALDRLVDIAEVQSIRDSGATAASHGSRRAGRFEGVVFADTPQAAIQDKGTQPYTIRPASKQALFWPGASHPVTKVNHPGVSKHIGWWSDAPS